MSMPIGHYNFHSAATPPNVAPDGMRIHTTNESQAWTAAIPTNPILNTPDSQTLGQSLNALSVALDQLNGQIQRQEELLGTTQPTTAGEGKLVSGDLAFTMINHINHLTRLVEDMRERALAATEVITRLR